MMVTRIENETDYDLALKRAEELWNAELGTPEGKELDKLIDMIVKYEKVHYPIPDPKDE